MLLDSNMLGPSPETALNSILDQCPQVKIILLAAADDDDVSMRSLACLGVAGIVLKDEAPQTLVRAVRSALEGGFWLSRRVIEILARPVAERDNTGNGDHLTEREYEVLALLAKGYANHQIAEALVIAEGTVKNHVVSIYQKLDLHSRAEAVAWAWEHKLNK